MSGRRAVGYCQFVQCEDYLKGVFLLEHGSTFYCPRCRRPGTIEEEISIDEDTHGGMYKTVRVEFSFDPASGKYREIAIVDIAELPYGGVFTVKSPLVRTEKRALKIAENVIGFVNSGLKSREHWSRETIINFDVDRESVAEQCRALDHVLEVRSRRLESACGFPS